MTNLVAELRKLHDEITECDGHESEMMALVRRAADALAAQPFAESSDELAELRAFKQAVLDPENQPSQFGTKLIGPTDGWTNEQRESMNLSALDQHPPDQGGRWEWRQSCPCRRCREEYGRRVAAQRRSPE